MADRTDRLVVTVDVECDSDGGPTWRYASPLSFRGVSHGLGDLLARVLDSTNAAATLLVSNVVLEDAASVAVLRDLDRVELGAHLHGDFLAPGPRFDDPAGAKTVENQNEYSEGIERAKLENLTELFRSAFGGTPTSFRAGRWSAAGRTARLLTDLGYRVDSSVSPHVHWTDGGRSIDYRRAPEQPYRPDEINISVPGELPLWELPVSIVAPWWSAQRPVWLRPSYSSIAMMRRVIHSIRRRHPPPRTFVAMLHNTELTEGTSPHSRTPESAEHMAQRLQALLHWAANDGMTFATLTEAASACASS